MIRALRGAGTPENGEQLATGTCKVLLQAHEAEFPHPLADRGPESLDNAWALCRGGAREQAAPRTPLSITHHAPRHVVPGNPPATDIPASVERLDVKLPGESHAVVETRRTGIICAPEVVQRDEPPRGLPHERANA